MLGCLKRQKKKIAIGFAVFAALFLIFVGPWPAFNTHWEGTQYCQDTLANVEAARSQLNISANPKPLTAGVGRRDITPEPGSPLNGASRTKGVHDKVWVKALALSDGVDTVVLISADMLIISRTVSQTVVNRITQETMLEQDDVFFGATHTHSGPGGWARNVVETIYTGRPDEKVFDHIVSSFGEAAGDALAAMEPAAIATQIVEMPESIRNRSFDGGEVDPEFSYLTGMQSSTQKPFHLAVYAAHQCNIWNGENRFLTSGDYPGDFQRITEEETEGHCMFMAGAVGSMATVCPTGASDFEKTEWIGNHLSETMLQTQEPLEAKPALDIASMRVEVLLPPIQFKLLSDKIRLSPLYLGRIATRRTHLSLLALEDFVMIGAPSDFSGELALEVKAHAKQKGLSVVVTSFNGDHHGYLLPDKYYRAQLRPSAKHSLAYYETNLMSFHGPHAGSYFVEIMKRMVDVYAEERAKGVKNSQHAACSKQARES